MSTCDKCGTEAEHLTTSEGDDGEIQSICDACIVDAVAAGEVEDDEDEEEEEEDEGEDE